MEPETIPHNTWLREFLLILTFSFVVNLFQILASLFLESSMTPKPLYYVLVSIALAICALGSNYKRYKYLFFLRTTFRALKKEQTLEPQEIKHEKKQLLKSILLIKFLIPVVIIPLILGLLTKYNDYSYLFLIFLGMYVGLINVLLYYPELQYKSLNKIMEPYLQEEEKKYLSTFQMKWYDYSPNYILLGLLIVYSFFI